MSRAVAPDLALFGGRSEASMVSATDAVEQGASTQVVGAVARVCSEGAERPWKTLPAWVNFPKFDGAKPCETGGGQAMPRCIHPIVPAVLGLFFLSAIPVRAADPEIDGLLQAPVGKTGSPTAAI
jgi:hypothetical protein